MDTRGGGLSHGTAILQLVALGAEGMKASVSSRVICEDCKSIDWPSIFSLDAATVGEAGIAVADLGSRLREDSPCDVCRFLRRMICDEYAPDELHLRAFSFFRHYGGVNFRRMPKSARLRDGICLAVAPGHTSRVLDKRDLQSIRSRCWFHGYILQGDSPIDGETVFTGKRLEKYINYDMVKSWISFCQAHHSGPCSTSDHLVKGLRLIDCRTRRIVKAKKSYRYCALSYVWGKGEIDELIATLARAPTGTADKPLPPTLSPALEDAIKVTRRLGLQYLWIDQYCIDQNDAASKHHQISEMDSIYARADITIIAAAGRDQHYGLPGVRNTTRNEQPRIRVGGVQLVSTMGDPRRLIRESTWSTRGWTYQEAVLSRRRLVFTDTMVYFECEQMNCCESIEFDLNWVRHPGRARFHPFLRPGLFSGSPCDPGFCSFDRHDTSTVWDIGQGHMHILNYASRCLTFETDTLKAFSGIMRHMYRTNKMSHIFGLPYKTSLTGFSRRLPTDFTLPKTITKSLTWFHKMGDAKRKSAFPSWSWAGWTACPDFHDRHEKNNSFRNLYRFNCYISEIALTDHQANKKQFLRGIRGDYSDFDRDFDESLRCLMVTGEILSPEGFSHDGSRGVYLSHQRLEEHQSSLQWHLSETALNKKDEILQLYRDLRFAQVRCLLLAESNGECLFMVLRGSGQVVWRIGLARFSGSRWRLSSVGLLSKLRSVRIS